VDDRDAELTRVARLLAADVTRTLGPTHRDAVAVVSLGDLPAHEAAG
jgi:hypothetical protein